MKITVEFFEDVGFQEGAVEVPSYGNLELEQEGMEYTDVHPAKGRIFDSIRVKEYFAKARCWNYLKLTMVNNSDESDTGVEQIYYGWVDNVAMASDNEEAPMVDVSWHVDLWRTWLKDAKFGYGMVVNRPDVGERPIQELPYRYYETEMGMAVSSELKTITVLGRHTYSVVYLIVAYVQEIDDNKVTVPCYSVVPMLGFMLKSVGLNKWRPTYNDIPIYLVKTAGTEYYCTSQKHVVTGSFLSDWGISPESVTGCWLTTQPFMLNRLTATDNGLGYSFGPSDTDFSDGYLVKHDSYYHFAVPCVQTPNLLVQALGDTHMSTEEREFGLCNYEGELVWKAPLLLPFAYIKKQLQISPTACSLELFFCETLNEEVETVRNKGMHVSVALPEHALATNSWSTYVISGQKEAVRQQRRIQQQQQLVGGLTSTMSGGVQGATMGVLAGEGAGLLAGANVGVGIASTAINFASAGYFNDKLNKLSDKMAAKQIDSIAVSGGSFGWLGLTYQSDGRMRIIAITKDEYSRTQFRNQIALNGLDVSEPTSDCTEACHGTGPYRIQNLIVTGSIPSEARAYIKQRFNDGVRLS